MSMKSPNFPMMEDVTLFDNFNIKRESMNLQDEIFASIVRPVES